MMQWLRDLALGDGLSPHGFCLSWDPDLLAWTILGDGGTMLAYVVIPAMLVAELRRRRLLLPGWVFALFGGFILLCGLSHGMMIWTLFHPAYWLEAAVKSVTAAVSLLTALMLPFARPRNSLLTEWWTTARRLRHERNNARQMVEGLCQSRGIPPPIWEDLPLPPPPDDGGPS